MSWLQGGPFLEVSFIMMLETDKHSFVKTLLSKIKSFTPTIEFAISENELREKLTEFFIGYPDDEKDPNTKIYHQAQIPVYVNIDGKRKSILSLRQISQQLLTIDFWFYGDESDVPEWNQIGIADGQVYLFKNMLHSLFDAFNFVIGTVGYENSVTDLFDTAEAWPDESYIIENINEKLLSGENYFKLIIANGNKVNFQSEECIKLGKDKIVFEA